MLNLPLNLTFLHRALEFDNSLTQYALVCTNRSTNRFFIQPCLCVPNTTLMISTNQLTISLGKIFHTANIKVTSTPYLFKPLIFNKHCLLGSPPRSEHSMCLVRKLHRNNRPTLSERVCTKTRRLCFIYMAPIGKLDFSPK